MAVSNPQSNMGTGGCSALEPYALQVTGDSMAPEFWDGCVIIVEPGGAVRNGSFVIVDYAGDTLFRQLEIADGRRLLKPLNADYPVLELTGNYSIRGVVTQRAGRRRAQHKHYE
jgi:DNA polymerase V